MPKSSKINISTSCKKFIYSRHDLIGYSASLLKCQQSVSRVSATDLQQTCVRKTVMTRQKGRSVSSWEILSDNPTHASFQLILLRQLA